VTRRNRHGLLSTPSPFIEPSPAPGMWLPGHCQACGEFGTVGQYWPGFLPGRYLEICKDCLKLGDEEIRRRTDTPPPRRDGAVL
jgi:hypothetical protein